MAMAALLLSASAPTPQLGHHYVNITLAPGTAGGAVFADLGWRRRAVPDANSTDVLLLERTSGRRVTNAVRAPAPGGVSPAEAATIVFEPVSAAPVFEWIPLEGTAKRNAVTGCSGAYDATLACWKAVDGLIEFDADGLPHEGWDASPGGDGVEFLELDLGAPAAVSALGIFGVDAAEDGHWPWHNVADAALLSRAGAAGPWEPHLAGAVAAAAFAALTLPEGTPAPAARRYYRVEFTRRHGPAQAWIKEVKLGVAASRPNNASIALEYQAWYAPYTISGSRTGMSLQVEYAKRNETASASWLSAHGLSPAALASGSFRGRLPSATGVAFGSDTAFDEYSPMERPATAASMAQLLRRFPEPVLFFPEDRSSLIRMDEAIPQHWADAGPGRLLAGTAAPGELVSMQLGVFAARAPFVLEPGDFAASVLAGPAGTTPVRNITLFNAGGIDYRGRPFAQPIRVAQGGVRALWFGLRAPQAAGTYVGTLMLGRHGFNVSLTVAGAPKPNDGADQPDSMARLAWLNAKDDASAPIRGYGPVKVTQPKDGGFAIALTANRLLAWSGLGATSATLPLLENVTVAGGAVLSQGGLALTAAGMTWKSMVRRIVSVTPAAATIEVAASAGSALAANVTIVVGFDGYCDVTVRLSASAGRSVVLPNITVAATVPASTATYLMGLGQQGGSRSLRYPHGISWRWSENSGGENQLWAGAADRGIRLKFKGVEADWDSPLHVQTAVPESWGGDAADGTVSALPDAEDGGGLVITAATNRITIPAAGALVFRLDALVTPVKVLNTSEHFERDRYYQYGYNGDATCEEAAAMGVRVFNIHQGTDLNPYINYPFVPDT